MLKVTSDKVFCPILSRDIEIGYCWEICNIATDDILLRGDTIKNWNAAQVICKKCGRYSDE